MRTGRTQGLVAAQMYEVLLENYSIRMFYLRITSEPF